MTTAEVKLTPKQEQVFKALAAGQSPAQVAKKLHTSSSNIYGHMRKMRQAGVTLPNETVGSVGSALSPSAEARSVSTANGEVALPEDALRHHIEASQEYLTNVAADIAKHEESIKRLTDLKAEAIAKVERYDKALEALS